MHLRNAVKKSNDVEVAGLLWSQMYTDRICWLGSSVSTSRLGTVKGRGERTVVNSQLISVEVPKRNYSVSVVQPHGASLYERVLRESFGREGP